MKTRGSTPGLHWKLSIWSTGEVSGIPSVAVKCVSKKEKVKKRNRKTENTVQSSNALHGVFSIFVCMTLINKAMRVNEEDY